ncbi:MAG: hypothetical protein QM820_20510 [Minicystis sp.]
MPNAPPQAVPAVPARTGALGFLRDRVIGVPAVSKKRKAVALAIAVCADLAQLVLWPAFAPGAASPFDDALDAVVALAMLVTLGFSGRLALALALELVPGAALFPTWSAVVATIPARDEATAPAAKPRAG